MRSKSRPSHDIPYLTHKDGRYVHRLGKGYALRRGRHDGLVSFDHESNAINFRKMFFLREQLDITGERGSPEETQHETRITEQDNV